MNYNDAAMKRNVICIKCRYITETVMPQPLCQFCGNIMITTIRSTMTDEVVTFNRKFDIVIED
jgi:galactose-1-phosphate uridylyltransferase